MKTIFDIEHKKSRALGAWVPSSKKTFEWTGWHNKESKAYKLNAIVYTCVHEISTSAASVPFKVVNKKTKEDIDNDFSRILNNPNPQQDRTEFWESVYAFYLLKGNVGIEAAPYTGSVINELYCIPFSYIEVHLNTSGMVNKYIVKSPTGAQKDKVFTKSSTTGRTKLLHLKTFNPENLWIGQPPLEAAGRDAEMFDKAGTWNAALIDNAARPSGVFCYKDETGGELSTTAYDRLKKDINEEYTGAVAAGTPILLDGGLTWQSTSMSPVEMDFLESRAASARVVSSVYGYPAMLLGLSGDNTYNNQKEARLALWTDTIMPLCDSTASRVTAFAQRLGSLNLDEAIVPNYENIGALQPIRDAIWTKACVTGKDILTINERRLMINLEVKTGYDGIVANAAQVPLDYALTDPANRIAVQLVNNATTTNTP